MTPESFDKFESTSTPIHTQRHQAALQDTNRP